MKNSLFIVSAVAAISGCQHVATTANSESEFAARCATTTSIFECDRSAILAMAGEYHVNFHFEEVAALRSGYEKKHGHDSQAKEWVNVIEDSGTHIVLQHILVSEKGEVTKHWRQDWQYEPNSAWEFSGNQQAPQWQRLNPSREQRQGAWLQTVWHVDDSPRYASIGRWHHVSNVSSWSAHVTARPLPRREYSTRNDYDVLMANNRQEITPNGWIHWQDNLKWDSKAEQNQRAVAREIGINTYTRVNNVDFTPAKKYWTATQEYWSLVRAKWQQTFAQYPKFSVRDKVEAMTMWLTLSAAADETIDDSDKEKQQEIERIFERYIIEADGSKAINARQIANAS